MYKIKLRKIGGSITLTVPPAIIDRLHLRAGETINLVVDGRRLTLKRRQRRPRYTLDELLAQCGNSFERTAEEQEWLDMKPVGQEIW